MAGVQVGARARRPVARCRLEEAAGNGNRDRRRRRRHQVQLGVAVTGHEELALVFVRRRIGRRRLRRGCQPLEIELVRVPLAVHLRHDVLVVVIPQGPRQFVVIHIRFRLPLAPSSRHLVGIGQLEFAIGSFPRDARGVTRVRQELE